MEQLRGQQPPQCKMNDDPTQHVGPKVGDPSNGTTCRWSAMRRAARQVKGVEKVEGVLVSTHLILKAMGWWNIDG